MKILALDIGGTTIKVGELCDFELVSTNEFPTEAKKGGEFVMKRCEEIITYYSGYERIGISTSGQVNTELGQISFANENIPAYTGMRVRERFQDKFKVPVAVENDVNAACLGEAIFGAGRGFDNFICLTYGTGIGGGIILNKSVYHGETYGAGEFGHIITHPGGLACACGGAGCYEQYASASALIRDARAVNESIMNGRDVFDILDNPSVKSVVENWADEIVLGLVSLVHIFNPPLIVLGGGVMKVPQGLEMLNEKLYKLIMPTYRSVQLKQAELGNNAGLMGAAWLASKSDFLR